MAKKMSTEDIEGELRKMIGNKRQQSTSQMKETHEIEADLKRMLNMSSAVVVTKEDLLDIKSTKPSINKQEKQAAKKKKKKKTHLDPDHPHHQHRQHQEEPGGPVTQEGSQPVAKKKNKKSKKEKNANTGTGVTEDREKEKQDSNKKEEDQGNNSHKKLYNSDFHRARYLDDKLTPAILNELEKEKIFPLKKKSAKFVNAKYFCRLCEYHCDNIPTCRQHANDKRHRRKKEIMVQDKLLKSLPNPSERHIEALDCLVENIYSKYGLTDEELKDRQTQADLIQDYLREKIPDLSLCMFGSSVTGLGLKTADVNMDLVLPPGANPALCLSEVYRILEQSEKFTNVKSDFQAKVPSVLFTSPCGTFSCQITVGNQLACQTSQYLAIYTQIDDRLRKLAVTFKYWGKICEVDNQDNGSLPAYCFGLMTIFYLQQCQPPVLPVLWKDLSEEALKKPKTKADVDNMIQELKKEVWTSDNEYTVGMLWKDLLMYYGVNFDLAENIICVRSLKVIPRAEKKWKSRRIAIEDPFSNKRNVARSLQYLRMFDYFFNCLRKACLYFSLPTSHQNISYYYKCKRKTKHKAKENEIKSRLQSMENIHISEEQTGAESKADTTIERAENIGTIQKELSNKDCISNDEETDSDISIKENLFFEECKQNKFESSVELDEDTSNDTQVDDIVPQLKEISINNKDNDEKQCNSCNVCDLCKSQNVIEKSCRHDVKPVCDREHSAAGTHVVEGSVEHVNKCSDCGTDEHEGLDNTFDRSELTKSVLTEKPYKSDSQCKEDDLVNSFQNANNLAKDVLDTIIDSVIADSSIEMKDSINETVEAKDVTVGSGDKVIDKTTVHQTHDESDTSSGLSSDDDMEEESPGSSPLANTEKRVSSPIGAQYNFLFDSETLTDGKGPSVFCPICEKEGHLKSNCPDDQLPVLKKLPPVSKIHLQLLTTVIKGVPGDFKLTKDEISEREFVRKNLEVHIQGLYPDAQLRLFGSSMNGFGFHQSDLDICVVFKDKGPEGMNFVEHIEAICKSLKTHRGLYGVFPITTAKVPIVKFRHRNSQLEGDISMYNILAMENTDLLYTYASIDPRVQTLGYAIKVFAKVCDIGDASRGSLSSYAYMLMMLHYLQHTKPPLIPVLQELHEGPKPEHIVEGCNTWFFNDLSKLAYVWPECGRNNQSVGELWLGFFKYYLEEFNFTEQVVTIRQFKTLTKFEKLWNGKCIAIEDPFDLGHNLGGGLTRKMNHYIQSTYVHARELYGTNIYGKPEGFNTIQDYFFDQSQLVDGEPPSDRLCRVCGKIGHIARECPRLIARKEREAAERKRREDLKNSEPDNMKGSPQHNMPPRQNNNRDRAITQRSASDPANGDSPVRGQGHQPFYRRQTSMPNQSPDSRQRRPLLESPIQDRYGHNYQSPRSPHQDFQQHHGSNRRPHPGSPAHINSPYRQQGYHNQQHQQYYPDNHNDNSSLRFNQGQSPGQGQGQNRNRNSSQYFVNTNYDPRSQHNMMQQGDNINYPSSPSGNRNQPQFRNQYYEGSPQVYVSSGSPESGGIPNMLYTNQPFNFPMNVFQSVPPLFVNSSMAVNHAYQPMVPFATIPPMANVQNNVPVCAAGWHPGKVGIPVKDEQFAVSRQETSLKLDVNYQIQDSLLNAQQLTESPLNKERKVNVQRNSNKEKVHVSDFGITVKNEYYSSKD